jgi:glycosyltransferase involved in cell wall biosynthesis
MLKQSIESVLKQTYTNFDLVVLDNSDESENINKNKKVCEDFNDNRINYINNKTNIGIIANWNKAIDLCDTKYFSIFHDDDVMLPTFLEKSIKALEENISCVFSYTQANKVDKDLNYMSLWSPHYPNEGLIKAPDYLFFTLDKEQCVTIAPTILYRTSMMKQEKFSDEICFNSFDFNLILKLAAKYDIFFVKEILVNYRLHEKQMSQTYWWSDEKVKGKTATYLELQNALIYAFEIAIKNNDNERVEWLKIKLKKYVAELSQYIRKIIKDL